VGGLAGGAYFSRRAGLVRPAEDRPVVRTGYDIAAVGAILSGLLLTIDLGRPLRFWHMLFQSENFPALMFKGWSPISFGAWAILLFGLLSVLSALGARTKRAAPDAGTPGRRRRGEGGVAKLVGGAGGLLGSSLPVTRGSSCRSRTDPSGRTARGWGAVHRVGGVDRRGGAHPALPGARSNGALSRVAVVVRHQGARSRAARADRLHRVAGLGQPGLGKHLGVAAAGRRRLVRILAPLRMHAQRRPLATAARLVLVGGFLLRLTTILASEAIDRYRVAAGL